MLVKTSVLVLILSSELASLYRPLLTALEDVFVPGGGSGELLNVIMLFLSDSSVDGSMLDRIRLS